jgi:hypothetical protein
MHNQPQTHVHPAWFSWIQRHAALSGLLLAQWMVTTSMILIVSVSDPTHYMWWGWLDWVNFGVAFFLGLAAAGVALGLSAGMADAYNGGKWLKGSFLFLFILALVSFDIWAGVAERSRQARPTPADAWLAGATGLSILGVVPISVLFVSVLHASLILFYGWSARPQVIESEEEIAVRQRKELLKAQHNAKMRAVQAGGLGAAGRALRAGLTGAQEDSISPDSETTNPQMHALDTTGNVVAFKPSKAAGKKTALQWTASDLQAYIRATYSRELDDATASNTIRSLGDNRRLEGVVGQPYYANNRKAKAWADRLYNQQEKEA